MGPLHAVNWITVLCFYLVVVTAVLALLWSIASALDRISKQLGQIARSLEDRSKSDK